MTQLPEIILTSAAFLLLAIYHIQYVVQVRRRPMSTSVGVTNHLRREWVQTVMEGGKDILAVQTLRNWVMASSFLASAAILIGLGVLGLAFRTEELAKVSHALNAFGTTSPELWLAKLMLLSVNFFFSFFNFSLSIRYYNHASFAINVPAAVDPIVNYDAVARIVNHGTTHYTLGMRGYYLAIPCALWLFGPVWFLMGAAVLTGVLYRIDRTV